MTKKKIAELELSLLHLQQNVEIPETHLIIHPIIQRAVEQVCLRFAFLRCPKFSSHVMDPINYRNPRPRGKSAYIRWTYLFFSTIGTSNFDTAQYHPHPRKDAKRQHFPQRVARTCECLDQVHPICHQTLPRRDLRNRFARNQLLAESGKGTGEHRGAVEE